MNANADSRRLVEAQRDIARGLMRLYLQAHRRHALTPGEFYELARRLLEQALYDAYATVRGRP